MHVNKYRYVFFFLLLAFAMPSSAQCPPGIPPNPGCIPPNVPGSPSGQRTYQPPSKERWQDKWGAIVIDSTTGEAGLAAEMNSKSQASRRAKKMCKEKGGKKCTVRVTYRNACAAIAWGDQSNSAVSRRTKEQAESVVMNDCKSITTNCQIVYSSCSYPQRVE